MAQAQRALRESEDLVTLKQQIMTLAAGFSIETTPGSSLKIPDFRDHLRPGTRVSVTFLPGSDFADSIATAKRLKAEGFLPAPHFTARSTPDLATFEDWLKRMQDEVGVDEAVVLGGGVTHPVGALDNAMQLLETGLFEKHGITRLGVAGHPEGSPDIAPGLVSEALARKNDYATRTGSHLYIATQFCFEAAPIIAWDREIAAAGNRLPIHIGIPGLATLKTLINHARACGIGPSMRVLTRQARNITKLLNVQTPDRLLIDLARYRASHGDGGIVQLHFYPLGGLRRSANWAYAVQDGDFTLAPDGSGFVVDREIG